MKVIVSSIQRAETDVSLFPTLNSVGVEHDPDAAHVVHQRSPGWLIHEGDFFAWAARTHERFECAAGNPPFIRYQQFGGEVRRRAIELCAAHGTKFTALSSSWAPFIVAALTLLKPGGRMAFVVPAEIGHAPYAQPVLAPCGKFPPGPGAGNSPQAVPRSI